MWIVDFGCNFFLLEIWNFEMKNTAKTLIFFMPKPCLIFQTVPCMFFPRFWAMWPMVARHACKRDAAFH
jgi:hypothetical protein